MATTPEGKVKKEVKRIIAGYGHYIYSNWPVPFGMGTPTLDCFGCVDGDFFAVETKAEKARLTPQQLRTWKAMRDAGAAVFIIEGGDELTMADFDAWLHIRVARKRARDKLGVA